MFFPQTQMNKIDFQTHTFFIEKGHTCLNTLRITYDRESDILNILFSKISFLILLARMSLK